MVYINGKIVGFRLIEQQNKEKNELTQQSPLQPTLLRTQVVRGYTIRIKYSEHSFYFTFNFDKDNNLLEMFVNSSSTSPTVNSHIQGLARMISNQLKYRIPIEKIIKHLDGLDAGESVLVKFPGIKKSKFIKSIPDLMAKMLQFYSDSEFLESVVKELEEEKGGETKNEDSESVKRKTSNKKEDVISKGNLIQCPSCGEVSMKYEEGCYTCLSCGYSKCS